MRSTLTAVIGSLFIAMPLLAQPSTPRISPHAMVSQTIGTADITIDYHRPGVKNRQIWGGLVPYDQPWRMGANEATTIEFSRDVMIDGKNVPAGKYSFFAVPGKSEWTLILNKDPEQWGAYGYDPEKDLIRLKVKPMSSPHTEWMRFTIEPKTSSSAEVRLEWEKIALPMTVEVPVGKHVWADIDEAMKKMEAQRGQTLGSAASWALDSGERLEDGLKWANESIAIQEGVFNLWTKARLLHKLGRSKEALPVMEKALAMAKQQNMPADFLGILEGTLKSIRAAA